ncbi:hypothetical protein BC828DRAFT_404990 [Blastocladiella britannica]|nr:hypothetical protein BC828DRAFT_404990 [Blastocladiella britannica]
MSSADPSASHSEKNNGGDAVDPEAASVVPAGEKSQFMSFVKTLASFTGDLSQLTCPAFLLSGVSLLEYSAHWADHPDLFAAIAYERDPADRMVAVTRWFLSTLYGSFHSRCKTGTEKKPFNPVLGEQFYCSWPASAAAAGTASGAEPHVTTMTCEQVSHHPPVGAFHIAGAGGRVHLTGQCGQKTKFKSASIKVEQTGRAVLTVHPPTGPSGQGFGTPDEYFITLPEMVLRGLLTGQLFVELQGKSSITSASGYQAVFEYVPKGWFTGDYHTIKGHIAKLDLSSSPADDDDGDGGSAADPTLSASAAASAHAAKKKEKHAKRAAKKAKKMAGAGLQQILDSAEILYELSGKWTTQSIATRVEDGAEEVLFDADAHPMVVPTVKPLDEQGELESRKLWGKVSASLIAGDYPTATATKSTIEDAQRALRKQRADAAEGWAPKNFAFVTDAAGGGGLVSPGGDDIAGSVASLSLASSPSSSTASPVGPASGGPQGPMRLSATTRAMLRALGTGAVAGVGNEMLTDDGLWAYVGGSS